jgi:RHS repeat-associated protein
VGSPLLWQARRLDPETGLYHYRHRYYQPKQGRFIQADPPGTWHDPGNFGNRYAFGGSMVGAVDPYGLGFLRQMYEVGKDGIARVNNRRVRGYKDAAKGRTMFPCGSDLAKNYPDGVARTPDGFPIFEKAHRYEGHEPLDPPDNRFGKTREEDYDWGNKQLGLEKQPEGFTWHHNEKGQLELIPTDLHDAVVHTGGWSIQQAAINAGLMAKEVGAGIIAMGINWWNNPGQAAWDLSPYSTVDDAGDFTEFLYETTTGRELPPFPEAETPHPAWELLNPLGPSGA